MSIRQDNVQIRIDFITDESKKFAALINDTKRFTKDIDSAQLEVAKLEKELEKLQKNGKDTTKVQNELATANQKLQTALKSAADAAHSFEKVDMSKLMPAQLATRAKQLEQILAGIPPHFRAAGSAAKSVENELIAINKQLTENRARTKLVATAMQTVKDETSGWQRVLDLVFAGGILGFLTTAATLILGVGKSAITASSDLEGLETSFAVLLHSEKEAKKLMGELQKFAAETNFESPNIGEAAKKLLAYGYSAQEILPMLRKVGDVASAVGVPIEELAAIVGKAKLGGLVQADELNQFAERGINVFDSLAKVIKRPKEEIKKLGSESKISYKQLEQAFTEMTGKGGDFEGMMAKQSKTFKGLMSTLSDNFSLFTQTIFGGATNYLKPVIAVLGEFFGKLTDTMRSGTLATGDYSGAINNMVVVFRGLSVVFATVLEAGKLLYNYVWKPQIWAMEQIATAIAEQVRFWYGFIEVLSKIPVLGNVFKPIIVSVGLLKDVFENASATFEGFHAAARVAIENVKAYFTSLLVNATIVGKKLELLLSFKDETKSRLQAEITALESLKNSATLQGKSVGEAYAEARKKALAIAAVEEENTAKKKANAPTPAATIDTKKEEKAAKERLKTLQDAQELELQAKENYYAKELLANEVAELKNKITKSDGARQELIIQQAKYDALLKIQRSYLALYKIGTEEYLKTEKNILELEKKKVENAALLAPRKQEEFAALDTKSGVQSQTGDKLTNIQAEADAETAMLHKKFGTILLAEQRFEIARLDIQSAAAQRKLDFLRESGLSETEEYKKTQHAKDKIDAQAHKQKEQLAKYEERLEESKIAIVRDSIAIAIELLSTDEAARKKHATAIKAFQMGEVITTGILEAQKIWASLAYLGPAQTAAAIPLIIPTALRTVASVTRIANQKFAKGGIMQSVGGKSHAEGGTKGYFDDGTQIEVERGEVLAVVNKHNAPLLSMLSRVNAINGHGVPFFARGGIGFPNTTPSASLFYPPRHSVYLPNTPTNTSGQDNKLMDVLVAELRSLKASVEKNREVKFYRDKLADAYKRDQEDREHATWQLK